MVACLAPQGEFNFTNNRIECNLEFKYNDLLPPSPSHPITNYHSNAVALNAVALGGGGIGHCLPLPCLAPQGMEAAGAWNRNKIKL